MFTFYKLISRNLFLFEKNYEFHYCYGVQWKKGDHNPNFARNKADFHFISLAARK